MEHSIEVTAEETSLGALAAFGDTAERKLPLTADQSYFLRLAIEEIATNVIKYGYAPGQPGPIQVRCGCEGGRLRVVVRDRGQPFDPRDVPDPDLSSNLDARAVGGLGVYLVRELADELDYRHDPASGWNELVVVKAAEATIFDLMRVLPIFKGFGDEELGRLAAEVGERLLGAGEVLFRQGEPGHECFVILAGELEVLGDGGHAEVRLEVCAPGQLVGELALLDASPRSATVRALTAARLAVLRESAFLALMHHNPEWTFDLLRNGAARLRRSNRQMIDELEAKNAELLRAYNDLQAAQAERIRLSRIDEELAVARRIQELFLPRRLPQPPGWQIAAFSRGAQAVGGDFFDCIELPGDRVGVIVADVCGKGVPAALFVALARSLVRASSLAPWAFQVGADADDLLAGALGFTNDYIAAEHGESNMFITLFYGMLDPTAGTLRYVNAGHNPPLLVGQAGARVSELESTALPLGIVGGQVFEISQAAIAPGEMLACFSDGITEAMSAAGEPFGDARLRAALAARGGLPAAELVAAIVREVDEFVGGAPQADDMTLLIVRRLA